MLDSETNLNQVEERELHAILTIDSFSAPKRTPFHYTPHPYGPKMLHLLGPTVPTYFQCYVMSHLFWLVGYGYQLGAPHFEVMHDCTSDLFA